MGTKAVACQHLEFLKLLAQFGKNKKQFKFLISGTAAPQIDAVSEIIVNFLNGHIKCNVKKFKKHATSLRKIANPSHTDTIRKHALVTAGHGAIIPLISLALPILMKLLKK